MAGRLSKEYELGSVLLLEAGGTPPPAAVVPHFAEVVGLDPDINNFFHSVPMTNASLKNGGVSSRISTNLDSFIEFSEYTRKVLFLHLKVVEEEARLLLGIVTNLEVS